MESSTAPTLDDVITSQMASLAVLFVFVVAFYAALLPGGGQAVADDLPGEKRPAEAHLRRLLRLMMLDVGALLFTAGCVAVMIPLTNEVLTRWEWSVDGRFPVDRGALLLINLGMLALIAAEAWLAWRLLRRRQNLKTVFEGLWPH